MKRAKALEHAERVLRNLDAGADEFPLRVVQELYVFGSFARGALEPHDLDLDVELNRDEEWRAYYRMKRDDFEDPYPVLRMALRGRARSVQILTESHDHVDFEMTLLWRRGDSLEAAMERLHAIVPNASAGRAERDGMMPEFEGIDRWIPRGPRVSLLAAASEGVLRVERLELPDAEISDPLVRRRVLRRWQASSPLYRAAAAVVGELERRGIDPTGLHLQGRSMHRNAPLAYSAGFEFRYFGALPHYFSERGVSEHLEIVRPTLKQPLHCLRLVPLSAEYFQDCEWS
jgi:predicted nucleotidyltransferase